MPARFHVLSADRQIARVVQVRLGPNGLSYPILRWRCIQMATNSGSAPRPSVSALDERASRIGVWPVPGDGRPLHFAAHRPRRFTLCAGRTPVRPIPREWTTLLSYLVHNDRFLTAEQAELWRLCDAAAQCRGRVGAPRAADRQGARGACLSGTGLGGRHRAVET